LLLHLRRFLLADADELAEHGGVKAGRLGFRVDVLDIPAECLALLLQPLDAFQQAALTAVM
jgi:hypothetical protein